MAEKRLAAIKGVYGTWLGIPYFHEGFGNTQGEQSSGCEPHGHMEAVGYDLYCKMLNEAVKKVQRKKKCRRKNMKRVSK